DVYKRQAENLHFSIAGTTCTGKTTIFNELLFKSIIRAVSYTHLRAHETTLHLVCRVKVGKKKGGGGGGG
ncbi:hypothetical protein ELK74_29000, partial [Klebsiella pneumoniae]|nr:hypothetical protein [Klebsiella pneumoniae]